MFRTILLSLLAFAASGTLCTAQQEVTFTVNKRYLNLPVSHSVERARMEAVVGEEMNTYFVVRLTSGEPDYWVFWDLSEFYGREITLRYYGDGSALEKVYLDDRFHDYESVYKEENRPQFHFTASRGWINDPNGLVYHDGQYHLFYQHNPYEREWENMHWGHAVSTDLVNWQELPEALYPDGHGTMFSGSAIIDHDNMAGYNEEGMAAMLAFYTAASDDRQVQCMAYSNDDGLTWKKYEGNPIIDSKEIWNSPDTRDPKVFRYDPAGHWVMVLNERDGHSIYTSDDLKNWNYESHITGFWECPELFELAVDGDQKNKMWVMYGASGTYMLGDFDGRVFTPVSGKHYYTTGSVYAAQTYSNIPAADGRRIQIGWGRIDQPGMPFNGLILLPTELTLRTTKDGPRLYSVPVREVNKLFTSQEHYRSMTAGQANDRLAVCGNPDGMRIRTTIKLSHATSAGLSLNGQNILDYDMNSNRVNGVFYSPQNMTSMEISADIYIDRTSVEVFIDDGAYSYSMQRSGRNDREEGLRFWGNNIEVKELELFTAKSIWNK